MLELCNVTLTNDQINLNNTIYRENLKNIQNSYNANENNKTENEKIIQKKCFEIGFFIFFNCFLMFICFFLLIIFYKIHCPLFLIIPILLSILLFQLFYIYL